LISECKSVSRGDERPRNRVLDEGPAAALLGSIEIPSRHPARIACRSTRGQAGSAIDWRKPRKSDRVASNRRTPNGSNGAFGSTGHRTVVCSFARTPVSRVSMIIRSALPWTSASKIVPLSLHRTIVAFWGEPVEALVGSPRVDDHVRTTKCTREGQGWSVVRAHVSRKRKLSCFAAGLRLKVRKRDAHEPNAFGRRKDRPDQVKGELMLLLPCFDCHLHRPAACRNLKVAHLIFTVTVRPRAFVFSHQFQTSSATAITAASI
jgi:hypothetical protein